MGELNNERQFFGEVRCKFTARKMRSGLASIYANVTAPTRQRYISVSLNVKVKPEQFLKGKQRCLISNELTGLDNFNNRIANGAIKAFKEKIDKINGTLQEADDPYTVDVSALILPKFSTPEYQKHLRQTNFEKYATNKLKDLFKAAGVSTDAEVTVQIGTEKVTKTVSSDEKAHLYLARHYFVSKMVRLGLRPDEIIKLTGHSNTNMVNDIYTHLSSTDRCDIITNALDRVAKKA